MLKARGRSWLGICAGLAVAGLLGCGDDNDDLPPEPRAFETASLTIAGGRCDECWRTWTIHSDRHAELEDATGSVELDLERGDYAAIDELITSREFAAAWESEHNADEACSTNALTNTLRIRWKGEGEETVVLSNGCKGHCDEPDYPLMRLRAQLFALTTAIECSTADGSRGARGGRR